MKRLILLAAITVFASTLVFADIPRPEPSKATPKPKVEKGYLTQMDIRLDTDTTEATLMIPKSQVKQLRAQLDAMDDDADDTAAVTSVGGLSRTQTIVSGMFLSLAIVFGGMCFVRSGKAGTKTAKTLVILTAVAAIASTATYVYANAGPPPEARSINVKMFSDAVRMYGVGWGQVRVVTTTEYDHIRLNVPAAKTSGEE